MAKRNTGNSTYDGIELGGERVTHEIEDEIAAIQKSGRKVTKLSMIGYSLGGLVARYAIGLLYAAKVFDKIQPVVCYEFPTMDLSLTWAELHNFRLTASWSAHTTCRVAQRPVE